MLVYKKLKSIKNGDKMKKTLIMILILLFVLVLTLGCANKIADVIEDEVENNPVLIEETKDMDWKDIELFDVLESETFKVSDFAGTPILIESFAVWCPTCTKQQKIFKDFIEQDTTGVIHVSLDTDPNEDKQQVIDHALSNGFNWHYSISPIELTQKLIDIYGVGVVNAPSVPVILVCEDLSERLLESGLKSVAELKEEIANGCN